MSDEYKPRSPKFVCPECGVKIAIDYPQGEYCVDCEEPLAEIQR